jgi:hypothetical protein
MKNALYLRMRNCMQLGMGFSIEASRNRCLKAAGIALVCAASVGPLGWSLTCETDWLHGIEAGVSMLLLAAAIVLFSLIAWVRWLDWSRAATAARRSHG